MKILLVHKWAPDDPSPFDWMRLVSSLSQTHEVLTAWRVVEEKNHLEAELAAGVMSTEEFRTFAPNILLMDGSPDPIFRNPGCQSRKIPWSLEEEFQASGGATLFLRAAPGANWEDNHGYADYGFPLAKSKFGGAVYVACPPNDWTIRISDWQFPADLLPSRDVVNLEELVIERPWVLDDSALRLGVQRLFWSMCDVKDPIWRYEGDLENGVRKPYVIAAWAGRPAPVFLITGDMFSDWTIGKGQNERLLHLLLEGTQVLNTKRRIVHASLKQHAWDVFICHASEDKDIARPLADALRVRGLRVWLDEIELQIGDNLLRRIDDGLARSRYGVVILSSNFFAKQWPRRELDGLTTRELADGTVVVLPIWHNLGHAEVSTFSLPLSNRVAGRTDDGVTHLADMICRRVETPSRL